MSKEIIESELKYYGYEQMFSDNFSLVDEATSPQTPEAPANSYTEPNTHNKSAIGSVAIEGFGTDQLQV